MFQNPYYRSAGTPRLCVKQPVGDVCTRIRLALAGGVVTSATEIQIEIELFSEHYKEEIELISEHAECEILWGIIPTYD